MESNLKKRTFIVGCGRSGTTLLASLIGAHPKIKGFPESSFFLGLVGQWDARTQGIPAKDLKQKLGRTMSTSRVRLGIAHEMSRDNMREFLLTLERPDLLPLYPAQGKSMARHIAAFIEILDRLTLDDKKEFWVEKTPMHVCYIDIIERYLKPIKFIHLVRSGTDVVASAYDASQRYPEGCWAKYSSLDYCINWWNHNVSLTLPHLQKTNHFAVSYEQLVDDTPLVLAEICRFLEVDYDEKMLTNYRNVAEYVSGGQPWKWNTSGAISNANSTKFHEVFTKEQQDYVQKQLVQVDFETFRIRKTAGTGNDGLALQVS